MTHRNAPLTPTGRLLLCRRIEAGAPVAHVAKAMGISRPTAYKWWNRYAELGAGGLYDRSSRPKASPRQISPSTERRILARRRSAKAGPHRIGAALGLAPSTVYRVLARNQVNRLDHIDRATATPIRRYEHKAPGDLVHVDIKKLGRIPPGGGHRHHGRAEVRARERTTKRARVGYVYIHTAVDDHSRLAYSEVLPDEKGATAAAFWTRAQAFFAAHGIVVLRVLTDNAFCYRGELFNQALGTIKHRYCRPYQPQTNGKVERFNRTLLEEWAYVRPYWREADRIRALAHWLHIYNHHRLHTAIGGPPVSRVSNLPRNYS